VRVTRLTGRFGMPLVLLAGGLAVGLLAEVGGQLGADSQDILFSGQTSIPVLAATDSTKIVLVMLVFKALAYAVSLGCGFRGGPIFPAIFLGVAFADLPVNWFHMSPTLAVAIGAAAGMASQTGLLFSPLIFASLLVGSAGQDAIPAAVVATAAAWLTARALKNRTEQPAGAAAEPAARAAT
jgi:H+/Cl- antiporter ClcA